MQDTRPADWAPLFGPRDVARESKTSVLGCVVCFCGRHGASRQPSFFRVCSAPSFLYIHHTSTRRHTRVVHGWSVMHCLLPIPSPSPSQKRPSKSHSRSSTNAGSLRHGRHRFEHTCEPKGPQSHPYPVLALWSLYVGAEEGGVRALRVLGRLQNRIQALFIVVVSGQVRVI